jgi:hypothetical protein
LAALSTSILCGCSAHPIPEDVVGLELHQIVDHIRCEAAAVVGALYNGEYEPVGLYSKKDLASVHDEYNKRQKDIERDQEYHKKLQADADELNEKGQRLKQRKDLYDLKMEKAAYDLLEVTALDTQGSAVKALERRADALRELIRRKGVEDFRYEKERMQHDINVQTANAKAKYYEAELSKEKKFVRKGKFEELDKFLRYRFTYHLDFKVTRKNSLESNLSYKLPIPLGTFTVEQINPSFQRQSESQRVVKAVASFEDLLKLQDCSTTSVARSLRARSYPIVGEVGLKEVFIQYMKIIHDDDKINLKADKPADTYWDKITFKTTVSGGLTPKIAINQAAGFSGGFTTSASRTDEHALNVFLTLEDGDGDKKEKSEPTKVEIVGGKLQVSQE